MAAPPENLTAPQANSPQAILMEASRDLAAVEDRFARLSQRVGLILSQAEQERGSIQHFIDSFALEREIQRPRLNEPEPTASALFDFEHIQRERHQLEERVEQARVLRLNIETTLQVVRSCRDQMTAERAYLAPETAGGMRQQQAMNAAREEERRRLAREIHDGPAQVLANAIFVVGIAEQVVKREPDKVIEQLSDLKALLKDGVAEIRRFMFDLRPSMLEDQGLSPTLRYYVGEYSRLFAKRVSLAVVEPLPPLTDEEELCIFRIVQEALQNIQKHAETDEARIELKLVVEERCLALTVVDAGRGFNSSVAAPRHGQGAGMPGMRERARSIGADLSIESQPDVGTTVRLRIPLRGQTGSLDGLGPNSGA